MIDISKLDMEGISEETKSFMKAVFGMLNDNKASESCDLGGLRMIMTSYEGYYRSSKKLITEGFTIEDRRGNKKPNSELGLMKTSYFQLIQLMKEFGLTPKSREHIKALSPSVDEDNPLAKFLNGDI